MIEENELNKIKAAVSKLQERNRRLAWSFRILLALWVTTIFATALFHNANAEMRGANPDSIITENSVLRVRGLIVVDQNGKERVQIGAPLPDPLLQGKRYKRNGSISGILLMDAEGNERSGYFTSDIPSTVALTLDTVSGQTAMFLANDETGANLQLHDRDNQHSIELVAVDEAPNVTVTRHGKKIFQLPEAKEEKK